MLLKNKFIIDSIPINNAFPKTKRTSVVFLYSRYLNCFSL